MWSINQIQTNKKQKNEKENPVFKHRADEFNCF
jgi:hypothetical protein